MGGAIQDRVADVLHIITMIELNRIPQMGEELLKILVCMARGSQNSSSPARFTIITMVAIMITTMIPARPSPSTGIGIVGAAGLGEFELDGTEGCGAGGVTLGSGGLPGVGCGSPGRRKPFR